MDNTYPMKWHKFLIYFLLWVSVLINVVGGLQIMTGAILGENAQAVYDMFPQYRVLNIIYGILCLGIAALCVVTRSALAHYRRIGPKCLLTVYALNMVLSPLYCFLTSAVTSLPLETLVDASTPFQFLGHIVIIVVNYLYYQKRQALFTE